MSIYTKFVLVLVLGISNAVGEGFTDSHVTFYGEVRQVSGANTALLQSGQLEMAFGNRKDATNRVSLKTELQPTGSGGSQPYSYSLQVPLAYLPAANRANDYLSIGSQPSDFRIDRITIDGKPATLADGSTEYFALSFANRADLIRLDLIIEGDSTDTDGDEMPDWWEQLHSLDATFANATNDADNDGWSNLEEYRRGSDPNLSNVEPSLATDELLVPEFGTAGCYIRFHDSDTLASGITLEINDTELTGFELRQNGAPITREFPLTAIQSGQLTIAHVDSSIREASLPIAWNDGGESKSGTINVRVLAPSTDDGTDASLWLDAAALTVGEDIASWPDRSGNDRNAMQPLKEHRPVVSQFGRHSAVEFSKASSHLFTQEGAFPAGDHTIIAAWKSPGTRNEPQMLLSSNDGFLRIDPTAEAISYPGAPVYQADGMAVRGYESTVGSLSASIFRRDGEALQNVFGLSFDGEEIAPETIPALLPTIGARRLASTSDAPITNAYSGHLLELLVFPTAVPEQKLRDVYDYIQSKWSGAIIWDFSTDLRAVTLAASDGDLNIIRGGHGADDLALGDGSGIMSGGPGDDVLRAGSGEDTFVFGAVDTGKDTVVGFDLENDVIDFSAHFWGTTGDARQFITTRFNTNFSTSVPTLDTVLLVSHPAGTTQEIALQDTIIEPTQLIELIVEGRIRMGSLTIPTDVSLASSAAAASRDESFAVELSRSGDGVFAAMEVPVGIYQDANGRKFVVAGGESSQGDRAVVKFARGEASKTITFRPIPDLDARREQQLQTAVLPHFRYTVTGDPAVHVMSEQSKVWLSVIETNALTTGQPARVQVNREGTLDSSLELLLELEGSAIEGTHINNVPRKVTIPAGKRSSEIAITTVDSWDGSVPRLAMLRIAPNDSYLVGNPHEVTLYASARGLDSNESGFDRWVTAATAGEITSYLDLMRTVGAERVRSYLQAYSQGLESPGKQLASGLSFRIVDKRPELSMPIAPNAVDLRWQVQSAEDASKWSDVSASFSETIDTENLRLLGTPLDAGQSQQFYRLAFSIEQGAALQAGLDLVTPSSRYGMDGNTSWQSDQATGNLVATASPGSVSRLIVEVNVPTQLSFEMSVADGNENEQFAFYIAGERIAETSGEAVSVQRNLDPAEPVLLMWEFNGDAGKAIIKDN